MTDGGRAVRVATADEVALIVGWAAAEGWNPGDADAACFRLQDPGGFFVGVEDGEPVAAVSVVTYGDALAFLGLYIVRPDRRGRGWGMATWRAGMAHAGGRPVGLDGVVAQQDNYRRSGFVLAHRNVRCGGTAAPGPAADTSSLTRWKVSLAVWLILLLRSVVSLMPGTCRRMRSSPWRTMVGSMVPVSSTRRRRISIDWSITSFLRRNRSWSE